MTVAEEGGSHGGLESGSLVVFLPWRQVSCGSLFTATVMTILNVNGIFSKLQVEGPRDLICSDFLEPQVPAVRKCGVEWGCSADACLTERRKTSRDRVSTEAMLS